MDAGVLTSIVSGVVTVAVALIGIRSSSAKIKADTEASIMEKEAAERAAFRADLRAEVDRLRQDCDRLRAECDRLTRRVFELEREVQEAHRAREAAEKARDEALQKLRVAEGGAT